MTEIISHELRDWQRKALDAWVDNDYKGVVEVATGGGKTIFAIICMKMIRIKDPSAKFIIVVPTLSLRDQWISALMHDGRIDQNEISKWSNKLLKSWTTPFLVLVVNTGRKQIKGLIERSSSAVMLIVDECHRIFGSENRKVLDGGHQYSLGLSATPTEKYNNSFNLIVMPSLGKIIFSYSLQDAIKDGVLSKLELVNVKFALTDDELSEYNKLTNKIIKIQKSKLNYLEKPERLKVLFRIRSSISNNAHFRVPLAVKLADVNRGKRIIIFHENIESAEKIRNLLVNRGHKAITYHSKIHEDVRISNLILFRKGIYDILISCRAIDEGVDIPEVQIGIIASGTASARQRVQRLGRVLRLSNTKSLSKVYSLYATPPEEARLVEESLAIKNIVSVDWLRANI